MAGGPGRASVGRRRVVGHWIVMASLALPLLLPYGYAAKAAGARERARHAGDTRSRALEDAASAFEDLTDLGERSDSSRVESALRTATLRIPRARPALGPAAARRVDSLFAAVKTAVDQHRMPESALAAAEGYRAVVEVTWPSHASSARQVAMLDYVGFRARALIGVAPVDWDAVAQSAGLGMEMWNSIRGRVHSPGLRDAMQTTLRALAVAAESREPRMARLAAQLVLDLVDLIEEDAARN